MRKLFTSYFFPLGILTVMLVVVSFATPVSAGPTHNMQGFAWSDNVGWISFNNLSDGSSVDYGVNVRPDDYLEGHAWSDSVGWIKFDPTFTGPAGAGDNYAARIESDDVTVTGWARACKGTATGVCGGVNGGGPRSDGWDGWIKLGPGWTGSVHIVNQDTFAGYGWGDLNIGWLDFNTTIPVRIPARQDPDFIAYTPTLSGDQIFNQPGVYAFNRPFSIQGIIENLGGTTKQTENFIAGFFDTAVDPHAPLPETEEWIESPFQKNNTRTIAYPKSGVWNPAVGTYSRKLCADMSPPNVNAVAELREDNNCSPLVNFSIKRWGNLRIQTVLSGVCPAPTFKVDDIEGTVTLSGGTTRVAWNYVSAEPGDNPHTISFPYGRGRAPKNITRQSCTGTDFATGCSPAEPVNLNALTNVPARSEVTYSESLQPGSVLFSAEYPCATVDLTFRYRNSEEPWTTSLTLKPQAEEVEFRWLAAGNFDMNLTRCRAKSPPTTTDPQGILNELGDFSGILNPLCPLQVGGSYCLADGSNVPRPKRYYITCTDSSQGFKADNFFSDFVDALSLPRYQEF